MALALAFAAPRHSAGSEPAGEGPVGDDCFLEPAVARYVADVQDRILERWELPPDSMANRKVVLVLTFRANGTLERTRIIASDDGRLKRSVAVAVWRASPFARVPPGAACLIGRPIKTTFRNRAD